jgi:hypothetical protein
MTIAPVTLRRAGPADLAMVVPLAVAFYAEDGFGTGEHALRSNLSVLLASPAARVAVAQSAARLLGFAVTTTSFGLENGLIAELEDLSWSRPPGAADWADGSSRTASLGRASRVAGVWSWSSRRTAAMSGIWSPTTSLAVSVTTAAA